MTTKRLTKRELREDPVLETFSRLAMWSQAHGRQLLIWVGGLVVAVVLLLVILGERRQNEEQASEQLLKAEFQLTNGDYNGALAGLTDVQSRFGGTPSATRALRDQADAKYLTGAVAEAQKLYEEYLGKVRENSIEGRAGLTGLAACYEQSRQFAKAGETYEKISSLSGTSELGSIALWSAGRC